MSDYRDLAKYLSKGFPQTPGSQRDLHKYQSDMGVFSWIAATH